MYLLGEKEIDVISSIVMRFACTAFIFSFSLMVSTKAAAQKRSYDNLTTINEKSKGLFDSLKNKGVDTVIRYYIGSAGCIARAPRALVYWQSEGKPQLMVYTTGMKRKKGEPVLFMKQIHHALLFNFYPLNLLFENYNVIKNDSLVSGPKWFTFNYTFESMDIKVSGLTLNYEVITVNRPYNINSNKIILIDNFLSYCLGEILD